jgi:transcription factor-like protein
LCHDQGEQPAVKALTTVIRLVGNIYASRSWSTELKKHVDDVLSRERLDDPFMAQARLLYSVALFWQGYQEEAKVQLELAISIALNLGMSRQEFATTHGAGDPVLAESWRRTWWSLYIVSAYHAGTLGTLNFTVMEVEASVDLPCEELEYETGVSPMFLSDPSLSLHAEGYPSAQDFGRL